MPACRRSTACHSARRSAGSRAGVAAASALTLALAAALPAQAAPPVFWEPTPYLSTADIPVGFYAGGSPGFLDTLEDGTLDGQITANNGVVIGPGQFDGARDSVDADDGAIDGLGTAGRSFFVNPGFVGVTFTFTGASLPTAFGLVWTDGFGDVVFSATDGNGVSLGSITRNGFSDGSISGTTAEDRFFGVQFDGGIRSITITGQSGGLELDHIQYGVMPSVPEPSGWVLLLAGIAALRLWGRRQPG
ncbi:hypothetical protein [Aquabacterium sp.]|uniref:hypothetical protein n=1 Tax=Aquabacterium sp. TaxID=1872578 RepID=UPI002CCDFB41|nr:hypothetical protein [Aquabacterium sp.]HSW03335.1 hypothetical protein [Aquabacterium sp.]